MAFGGSAERNNHDRNEPLDGEVATHCITNRVDKVTHLPFAFGLSKLSRRIDAAYNCYLIAASLQTRWVLFASS